MDPERLLRSAGQPASRPGRLWTWCANGTQGGEVKALLTQEGRVHLVASTARIHRYAGVGRGERASRVTRRTSRLGKYLRMRRAGKSANRIVYGIRRGRITFTAVVAKETASNRMRLRAALREASLR
jgi:hypothetical protein